jgi:hypothetical protein
MSISYKGLQRVASTTDKVNRDDNETGRYRCNNTTKIEPRCVRRSERRTTGVPLAPDEEECISGMKIAGVDHRSGFTDQRGAI